MRKFAQVLVVFGTLLQLIPCEGHAAADRYTLTPEQKERLKNVELIEVRAISLTEKGTTDPAIIGNIVSQRLQIFGYTITNGTDEPYDVVVKVKCEERKSSRQTSRTRGISDHPDAPARLWTGPACLLTYFLDGQQGPWEIEVRTEFQDAIAAAQAAGVSDSGSYALNHLQRQLEHSDFPVSLTASWGQSRRLAGLLTSPEVDRSLKLKIFSLAGQLSGPIMLEALQQAMVDPTLAPEATEALGRMGEEATPILLTLLETSNSIEIKAAAAKALGEIGARSGNVQIIPALLVMVKQEDLDLRVQTEIVRTLGKIPDRRSVPTLEELNYKAWSSRSTDPQMQELREATVWSLWQINPSAHAVN